MKFFQRKIFHDNRARRLRKKLETLMRCSILLFLPFLLTVPVCWGWYRWMFKKGIHFSDGMEGIATAAWIPTFGFMYTLLAAVFISTVWGEYKAMRTAVKRYDIDTFMDLRDETMSPLVHCLMFVLSSAILGGFMGLKYPSAIDGLMLIGSTTYIFALVFLVLVEIDNPCSGLWFIRSIHPEWIPIDPRVWRQKRCSKLREDFQKTIKIDLEVTVHQ